MLVSGLLGFVMGWVVSILVDMVPAYANEPPNDLPEQPWRAPGIWRSIKEKRIYGDAWIELAGTVGGLVFGLTWFLPIYGFLLLLTVIDLRYRLIPNVLVYPAVLLVLGVAAFTYPDQLTQTLMGGGMAFGVFFLTALMQPGKLGGGDVKLAGLIGLAFGFPGMLWALLMGSAAGAVVAVVLFFSPRPIRWIPYAPFLCLGALLALIYNPFV
ncbi:MAG: hypothetical protein OHK0046_25460 [Anaerolineae bacterium]